MPGMDGGDLAREIRRPHGDRPVVLTASDSDVLARDCTHGLNLLHEPYSVEPLSRILRRVITRRRKGRSGATFPGPAGLST
ncbi:hypothetical protein MKL09_18300 [Methylobacterium sp. J-048]|uniref:hypothetical protein n=1 Tax=Methylobacterium sp. J-048 TaxID=2836635 RepID=UPI001FB9D080|nr:hypothetical protein [Methylobacterium sp. J-048]MCJ2058493.1 hypothetical protein [Methylobacterium sp. J-048]